MTKRKLTRAVSGQAMRLGLNDWNTVCDTVERVNAVDENTGLLSQNILSTSGEITVRNSLCQTVPSFGVLIAEKALHETMLQDEQLRFALNAGIEIVGKQPSGSPDDILCIVQETAPHRKLVRGIVFGPTCVRVDVTKRTHLYAKVLPGVIDHLQSSDSGPVRLIVPAVRPGVQICYGIIGLEKGDPVFHAKELFPAVAYRREREETQQNGSVKTVVETFVVCPGGRGEESSLKTVHVLNVEGRTMSTDLFGTLPVAMNNFDAVMADNGYGQPLMVCSPGEVDEGIRYPVQRYDFEQEQWSKADTNQSLAGCPAYLKDEKIIVAGGQSAYDVSNPVKLGISGTTQFYGHHVTPFWSIDPISGALETRTPRRQITCGTTEQAECHVVNQEKRFLKQNFKGIPFSRSSNGQSVEFLAVGGTELLGYQSKAVVSYTVDSIGAYVDCENNENRILNKCELFPDTPLPLGECCAVRTST